MAKSRKETGYSKENLKQALDAVKNGRSIRQAAKDFKVPFTTLYSRHNGTYSLVTKKGPDTVLSEQEEHNLVTWMLHLGTRGYPQTKTQLLDSVQLICKNLKKKTPFINNRPSKRWYSSFLKRHKDVLSLRTSQNLTKRRAAVTERALRGWFEQIAQYLESKNLLRIESSRVFNLDESAFFLAPKTDKVIVRRGQKAVYNLCNDDKECLTTLITCNAKGGMPPGLIMFKGAKLPANIAKFLPNTFVAGKSENGWMTGESFYEYIVNVFYPWCVNEKIVFPLILYVDGHSSHLTLPLSEFCAEKEIELIFLYPNATHLMQPLDVALFKPLKKAYKDAVMEWRQDHSGESLNRENFGSVITKAIRSLDIEKILSKGFEACGRHPFSADAIDYSRTLDHTSEGSNEPIIRRDSVQDNSIIPVNIIEKHIENDTLERFKKSAITGVWQGPEHDRGLYEFWLRTCKNDCNENPDEPVDILEPLHILTDQENELTLNPTVLVNDIVLLPDPNHSEILTEILNNSNLLSMDIAEDVSREKVVVIEIPSIASTSDTNNNSTIDCQTLENVDMLLEDKLTDLTIDAQDHSNADCENVDSASINSETNCINENGNELESEESNVPRTPTKNATDGNMDNQSKFIPDIPSPFKKLLFWPEAEDKKKDKGKRRKREKLPSVASGPEWIAYHKKKQREKQELIQKQIEARSAREQQRQIKENQKMIKKEQIEERKKQRKMEQEKKEAEKIRKRNAKKNKAPNPKKRKIRESTSPCSSS